MNRIQDENKRDKDTDIRKIRDLEKQISDQENFNENKESYQNRINKLIADLESEKKDKQLKLGTMEREKI